MYLAYLLFFFFFTINTADSKSQQEVRQTEELFEILNQFNQLGLGFQPPMKACPHCWNVSELKDKLKQEEDLLQQCAVDLCGPANESLLYVLDNNIFNKENIDPEIARKFNEEIRPVIEAAFQVELNYNKSVLESLQTKLQNSEANLKPQEWNEVAKTLSKMSEKQTEELDPRTLPLPQKGVRLI